jgi:hypothetical protein
VTRFTSNRSKKGQADMRGRTGGEFNFGDFRRFHEPHFSPAIATDIDTCGGLKAIGQMREEALVHVGASELRIATGRLHLEYAFAEFHNGHVKRAAT